jgi:hypothetical protein
VLAAFFIFRSVVALSMGSLFFFRLDTPAARAIKPRHFSPVIARAYFRVGGAVFRVAGVAVPIAFFTGILQA